MKDTLPHMEKLYRDLIMNRSGAERLKMGCSMHTTAQKIVKASILAKEPLADSTPIRRKLFLRFYEHDFNSKTRDKILQALETPNSTKPDSTKPDSTKPDHLA